MGDQLDLLADPVKQPRRRGRRERDAYFTPMHAIAALRQIEGESIRGQELVDPCCGDGRMAEQFALHFERMTLNDIAPAIPSDRLAALPSSCSVSLKHLDATIPEPGLWWGGDWVVTNPPWRIASDIAQNAIRNARCGVALLLRLSFLEATKKRQWLKRSPPRSVIVLPRISFNGSGKTDSVCPAWFLWGPAVSRPGVHIFGKADAAQLALTLPQ